MSNIKHSNDEDLLVNFETVLRNSARHFTEKSTRFTAAAITIRDALRPMKKRISSPQLATIYNDTSVKIDALVECKNVDDARKIYGDLLKNMADRHKQVSIEHYGDLRGSDKFTAPDFVNSFTRARMIAAL